MSIRVLDAYDPERRVPKTKASAAGIFSKKIGSEVTYYVLVASGTFPNSLEFEPLRDRSVWKYLARCLSQYRLHLQDSNGG